MNYIHAENSIVIEYPYSIEKMRSDNPQTSFPIEMSAEELAEWGVFAVEEQAPPTFNEQTESIEHQPPALVNGVWVQCWVIVAASAEEKELRTNRQAALVREKRNRYLTNTDWTQLKDYQGSSAAYGEWKEARQALRDVPLQAGFPWDVTWPMPDSTVN